MPLDPDFSDALAKQGIELQPEVGERLQRYAESMWKWNESLNLTRHTSWDLFVSRDLRDVLQLAPLLESGEDVLDLGSGNGVPGIPLSIVRPDVTMSLAESVGKRAKVLGSIIEELELPVAVYEARGEHLLQDIRFTTIVARAVGSLSKFCKWMEPNWTNVGRLLLIKGPKWVEERGEARHQGLMNNLDLRRVAEYPLTKGGQPEGAILQVALKQSA